MKLLFYLLVLTTRDGSGLIHLLKSVGDRVGGERGVQEGQNICVPMADSW